MKLKRINTHQVITLGNLEPFELKELKTVNSDSFALVIQLFTHGGAAGIQGAKDIIPWEDVVKYTSATRTINPVRLDLCGVCSSYFIENSLTDDHQIDQVWVTTKDIIWQSVYNWTKHASTYEEFLTSLREDDEVAMYAGQYKRLR